MKSSPCFFLTNSDILKKMFRESGQVSLCRACLFKCRTCPGSFGGRPARPAGVAASKGERRSRGIGQSLLKAFFLNALFNACSLRGLKDFLGSQRHIVVSGGGASSRDDRHVLHLARTPNTIASYRLSKVLYLYLLAGRVVFL